MPKLTKAEKEIRTSRGISIHHFWPFALIFLAATVMSFDHKIFPACMGRDIDGVGRVVAFLRIGAAIPCSFHYIDGSPFHYLVFACLWISPPFAVMQFLWMRRHESYWNVVREREKAKRVEKRLLRGKAPAGGSPSKRDQIE